MLIGSSTEAPVLGFEAEPHAQDMVLKILASSPEQ
jgi:hypothetical protein